MRAHKTFRSKVDRWLGWTFALTFMVMIFGGAEMLSAAIMGGSLVFGILMSLVALILIAGAGLMAWTLGSTFYSFENRELLIRSGPFAWRLPVADITEVKAMRNPASGPALSLDRLLLFRQAAPPLAVSPLDKEGFLAELEARKAV